MLSQISSTGFSQLVSARQWLGKLEKSIVGTTSGFAVGDKLSAADITIYYFLTFFFDDKVGSPALPSRSHP